MDSSKGALQAVDVVAVILQKIESPQDLLSAAAVCRTWRAVANDPSQLRSWTLDDVPCAITGTKVSLTPMLPKTPPPRHWINPTAHSPFASFNTPRSLRIPARFAAESSAQGDALPANSVPSDGNGQSPRTPSPIQQQMPESLKQTISHKMIMGRADYGSLMTAPPPLWSR